MTKLFVMVTADPDLEAGGRGRAADLIGARLERAVWPLYAHTPNRIAISAGDTVAFYVGGSGPNCGCIVATAIVAEKRPWRSASRIDPERYATMPPVQVLKLGLVRQVEPPLALRALLEESGQQIKNLGNYLQGGCRTFAAEPLLRRLRPQADDEPTNTPPTPSGATR